MNLNNSVNNIPQSKKEKAELSSWFSFVEWKGHKVSVVSSSHSEGSRSLSSSSQGNKSEGGGSLPPLWSKPRSEEASKENTMTKTAASVLNYFADQSVKKAGSQPQKQQVEPKEQPKKSNDSEKSVAKKLSSWEQAFQESEDW